MDHISKIVDAIMERLDMCEVYTRIGIRIADDIQRSIGEVLEPKGESDIHVSVEDLERLVLAERRALGNRVPMMGATGKYMPYIESNRIDQFIAECCDRDVNYRMATSGLFKAYAKWLEETHGCIPDRDVFDKIVRSRRDFCVTGVSDYMECKGIRLKEQVNG